MFKGVSSELNSSPRKRREKACLWRFVLSGGAILGMHDTRGQTVAIAVGIFVIILTWNLVRETISPSMAFNRLHESARLFTVMALCQPEAPKPFDVDVNLQIL